MESSLDLSTRKSHASLVTRRYKADRFRECSEEEITARNRSCIWEFTKSRLGDASYRLQPPSKVQPTIPLQLPIPRSQLAIKSLGMAPVPLLVFLLRSVILRERLETSSRILISNSLEVHCRGQGIRRGLGSTRGLLAQRGALLAQRGAVEQL